MILVDELSERRDFLSGTPFFGGLTGEALDLVVGMLTERRYPASAAVFREGEQGRAMYIVRQGDLIKYQSGESGRLVKLMRFRAGDFFGETSLIDCQPNQFTVAAETSSVVYELTNRDLYQLYQSDIAAYVMVLQNMNRELCRRLRKSDSRITEYADEHGETSTQIGIDIGKIRRLLPDE